MSLEYTIQELRIISARVLRPARILSMRHVHSLDRALREASGSLVRIYNPDLITVGDLVSYEHVEPHIYRIVLHEPVVIDMRTSFSIVNSAETYVFELPIERVFMSPDLADNYDPLARACIRPVLSRRDTLTERARKILEDIVETRLVHNLRMWLLEWEQISRELQEIYKIVDIPEI